MRIIERVVKSTVPFDAFAKLDLVVGKVIDVVDVVGSEKLYRMTVDLGAEYGMRTIFAGVKPWYGKTQLLGKLFIFVANLTPRKMPGGESQGMMLAACETDEKPLLLPVKGMPVGAKIR